MEIPRPQLSILLNALYSLGNTTVNVNHPSDAIGELMSIELDEPSASETAISTSPDSYSNLRSDVRSRYGSSVVDELPEPQSYLNALLAGGLIEPTNADALIDFIDRYGYPDLSAGHRPVVAGFDTNLLPWRIASVLDLAPGEDTAINGFALATGVRDELNWDQKRTDTRELEEAYGPEFDALWNQPAGSRRQGRLGETYYRQLRDHRYADEFVTERGDEEIVSGYDDYQDESRKDVLLFSNDRDFVERAVSHRVKAKRVEFPSEAPDALETTWDCIQDTLYMLTILFGVLELPKVTLYGVWKGKGGDAWQEERVKIDCRSPKIKEILERDLEIVAPRN